MTVFVYVNTSKQIGDAEHIKVFANQDAAETWFEENDPEVSPLSTSSSNEEPSSKRSGIGTKAMSGDFPWAKQ